MTSHSHSDNNSFQNWQSNRCDFCMYHELIFDQLERLKEAMIMKNQRIKQLQDFIGKMSEMAFIKNPMISSSNQLNSVFIQKSISGNENESNSISQNSLNDSKNNLFRKKLEQSSQISFQDMKLNTPKFQIQTKQTPDFMKRFQKIKQLNELKKELDKQISQTADKENNSYSERNDTFNNSRQFDTLRTLSEPQEEGRIGSIAHSSCENSRLREFDGQKTRFQDFMNSLNSETDKATNQSLRKSNSFEDKLSINIIKQNIKKLQ